MVDKRIVLFHPHVPKNSESHLRDTLESRWIGHGPKVAEFEHRFLDSFAPTQYGIAVSSGTSALHLAYMLAGIKAGDEVIVPVLTCAATNIPFLYIGANVIFADIERETLNVDVAHVRRLITERTRAIVCVHYGGLPCNMEELLTIARPYEIPVIQDAAHALGALYRGRRI